MIVCPDCRSPLEGIGAPCTACRWTPRAIGTLFDYMGSKDRASAELTEYVDTYDTLAERNMSVPVESNTYVHHLASRFCNALGDLSGKRFCDVGAGRGYLIQHAARHSPAAITAVDIAAPSLRQVAERHGVVGILANAENLPFEREFDVLAATDILEHVLNMGNFLVTANWALRDGGTLGIRVPYREDLLLYSNFHGLPMHFTHLRTFDRALLIDLVESAGFEITNVHYDGFNPNYPQTWLRRLPRVRAWAMNQIRKRFASDDDVATIDPRLGQLLMKPIEIGVIAKKVRHLVAVNAHASLTAFYEERKKRGACCS